MDLGDQNQVLLKEDVDLMKNQIYQLVEAMLVLTHKKDNIQ